jgi:hypothetical protein
MTASPLQREKDQPFARWPKAFRWALLLSVAAAPRLWIAFTLPNPDGDAYAYLETIERMRANLVAGTFSLKTLYNFWLPLYQFVCALLSALVNHPVYISKLVSALCGVGVCALVYALTRRLTANTMVAFAAALFVAVNPLHVLYSAFTLTEIPHTLAVMGSLYAVVTRRWTTAAVCAALAGFIRVESWMLIALLPAIEWLSVGRVSIKRCALLLVAPLLWLLICWAATGDSFAYFHERSRYINETLTAYPHLQTLTFARLERNGSSLIHSANPVVLLGCLVAAGLILKRRFLSEWQHTRDERLAVVATAVFFFAYLGFLVAAFVSGNQPDIWERYGLIFFSMGTPLAAWAMVQVASGKRRVAIAMALAIAVVCGVEARTQIGDAHETARQTSAQRILANNLQTIFEEHTDLRILCDDAGLPALTRIPPDRFITSTGMPSEPQAFLAALEQRGIDYIVYRGDEGGSPLAAFPELSAGAASERFQLVVPSFATDWHGHIYLYRLKRRP